MDSKHLFTSESVTEGHPDKVADQISDALLDAMIVDDPFARVACETLVTTGLAVVSGEVTTDTWIDIPQVVRKTILDIGYDSADYGFDGRTCAVMTTIDKQSSDIAMGVDRDGAGDQGLMFGYACDETPELMPAPISYAHKLVLRLAEIRKQGVLDWVRPDGKSQVSIQYEELKPVRIDSIVIAIQHSEAVTREQIAADIEKHVIRPVIPEELVDDNTVRHVNPTGRFVIGGPMGDCGLTGRKTIVDTYGGWGRHGGGAFSGKDPSKVDRSATYMARYIAKNIVAAGLAQRVEVQLAYAIGVADPVSVWVETRGKAEVDDETLRRAIRQVFPLTPKGMIEHLNLRRPIYLKTAAYGHFGREIDEFTWERTDKVDDLRTACKL